MNEKNFDLIKYRKYGFISSIVIIVVLFATYFFNGLALDITFRGGTRLTVEATGEIDTAKAQTIAQGAIGKQVTASIMKTFNPTSDKADITMLRLDVAGSEPLSFEDEQKVKNALADVFSLNLESAKNETVSISASIGRETLEKGLLAVLISSALILFYVAWRFAIMSGFSAAFTAILALIHDVLVLVGFYIAFKLPINDVFIAAVLTVIGYSINDTIIMYDRIRENSTLMRKGQLKDIVNVSIYQTLSRSFNTLGTTLISTVSVFIFASIYNVPSLRDFGLALSVGMISGMYSSVFVAIPLWLVIREKRMQKALKAT